LRAANCARHLQREPRLLVAAAVGVAEVALELAAERVGLAAGEARARVRAVGQAKQQRLDRRAPQLRRVERPLARRAHRVERQHLGVAREQRAHEAARHLGQRRRERRRARRRAQRAVGARRFVQRAKAPAP